MLKNLATLFAMLSCCVYLTISGNLLTDIGSAYISDGGNLLEKIHPGSYLAILAGIFSAASGLHGMAGPRRLAGRNPELTLFLSGLSLCLVYALVFTGTGNLVPLIDTYLPAGMLALALCRSDPASLSQLRLLLQLLLMANALLAISETSLQANLIAIPAGMSSEEEAFRPTALYDHALTGASATMLGWLLRPDPVRAPTISAAYQAAMFAALFCFGERTPIAITIIAVLWRKAASFRPKLLARRLDLRDCASLLLGPAIMALLAAAVIASGIGGRLVDHLYWDESAGVRLRVFNILGLISTPELVFGTRREDLLALLEPMRLAWRVGVIENFWLGMLLTLGLIGFPIFTLSFVSLLRWLWRQGDAQGRTMVLTLVLVATASNSLGRKSMLLAALTLAVLATRTGASASHRRAIPAQSVLAS